MRERNSQSSNVSRDKVFTAPQRSTFWQMLGPGGLSSFLLALGIGALGLGLPALLRLPSILATARRREHLDEEPEAILVLGRRLQDNRLTEVFCRRLEHALELWRTAPSSTLIIAGGITGGADWSEAEAGRTWLLEQGVPPESVLIEDRSQHTLENLWQVRELIRSRAWKHMLLVTDPLHLERSLAYARGLGLSFHPAPAPKCPPVDGSWAWWRRAIYESFLIHWYRTGWNYSKLIRSRKQLERVS